MSYDRENVIEISNLKKWFPLRRGFLQSLYTKEEVKHVKAIDDISFNIKKGEFFGLAGESGCGKTTTGKTILRLLEPTSGKVIFGDQNVFSFNRKELKEFRKKAQVIYQDPYESLDPRMTIYSFVAEPLLVHNIGDVRERVKNALEMTELIPAEEFFPRFPHELSGGQRQRVAIARAMILNPDFIVADEPVSMLDVSIRSSILEVMVRLRDELGISYLYITHDLATARQVCDRIAIMYLGKIVEMAQIEELLEEPLHPYTQALIAAVPVPDPTAKKSMAIIKGEIPSPMDLPTGCRFNTRCPHAKDICFEKEPELIEVSDGHITACHLHK